LTIPDRARFIRGNTTLMTPPLVPEVRLHLAHEAVPLWQKTEEELGEMGLAPPFWAFAWAGGQALARHVLDHPEIVQAKRVIDLASGSGLVGIAAMKAGAASVLAADIDAFSVEAIGINAEINSVSVEATGRDLLGEPATGGEVILVGDLFYEKGLAEKVFAWLEEAEGRGIVTLIGDPGRSYLPRDRLTKLGEYRVEVTRDLEDAEVKLTSVWRPSRYC
jgi:predicted nicotinamide N-methyase